jgi:hypothetical protein
MLLWPAPKPDDPDVDQKRQFPRYALEAAVTLVDGERSVAGRTSNLSRGGVCGVFDDSITIGARVTVDLALIFENDSLSEPLSITGRVVWCTPLDKRYQVGLAFLPMTGDNGRFLDVFLKFLAEGKRTKAAANDGGGGSRDPFDG